MAYNPLKTALALQTLRAPLNPNPADNRERCLADLCVKYRTYYMEYNVEDGAAMLPRMFTHDFGNEMGHLAYFLDSKGNQFELLVEKIEGNLYFTRGWRAIKDFYDLRVGGWLSLMYTGQGYFGLLLEDRFRHLIAPPTFVPPARFYIHKPNVPPQLVNNPAHLAPILGYQHDGSFFGISCQKNLTDYDIFSGYLMVPYHGFGEYAFDGTPINIKLIDKCGSEWNCILIPMGYPSVYYNLGGDWIKLVAFRRLSIGDTIKLGVEGIGHNEVLYLTLDR